MLFQPKVVLEILGRLDDPRDLARVAQVCRSWNDCSQDPTLWRRLPLSQWERGVWRFDPVDDLQPADLPSHLRLTSDEPQHCQIYDNLVSSLLPKVKPSLVFLRERQEMMITPQVGASVYQISLTNSRLSMDQLREVLQVKLGWCILIRAP